MEVVATRPDGGQRVYSVGAGVARSCLVDTLTRHAADVHNDCQAYTETQTWPNTAAEQRRDFTTDNTARLLLTLCQFGLNKVPYYKICTTKSYTCECLFY